VAAVVYADIAADAFQHLSTIDAHARCGAFISELERLTIRLNLPTRLRDVGIPQNALAKLSAHAMKQQRLLVNNPRTISELDALSIYTAAW
jgi:alcohol dehydrogenase class IV